jgi:hypothetical protein
MNDRLSAWLRNMSDIRLGALLLFASFAVNAPLVIFMEAHPLPVDAAGPIATQSMNVFGRLFVGSVVAPLIETALFQFAPVLLLRRRLGVRWPLVLMASATLFAAAHTYSLHYIVFGFLVGLVLAYGFAVRDKPGDSPFVLVCTVHGLRNAVVSLTLT